MSEHVDVTEATRAGFPPLPAIATPGPGRQGGGKARLLDFAVDKATEGDVAGKAEPVRRRDGGE